jgi:hypothetical protein
MANEADRAYAAVRTKHPVLPDPRHVVRYYAEGKLGGSVALTALTVVPSVAYDGAPEPPPDGLCSDCHLPVTGWRDYSTDEGLERIWQPCGHART